MLPSLTLLLACQLIGTIIQEVLDWPLPGPVIGMVILFLGLSLRRRLPEPLHRTAQGLLDHLSLLFVPAGVGVMQQLSILGQEWLPIAIALVGGTVLTIAVTGLAMQLALRVLGGGPADPEGGHDS